jgi:peptidoglycan/LPS O-acetylase OafA/YrhL
MENQFHKTSIKTATAVMGLLIFSIMLYHYSVIIPHILEDTKNNPDFWYLNIFKFSPLHIFWLGHEGMIMLLVFLGYILFHTYQTKGETSTTKFVFIHYLRLYLPYFIALIVVLALYYFHLAGVDGYWHKINKKLIKDHLVLVSSFQTAALLPVTWVLVHVARLLLLSPLLIAVIRRFDWKWILPVAFGLSYGGFQLYGWSLKSPDPNDYARTLVFLVMFVIGALIAKHQREIVQWFVQLPMYWKFIWIVVGLVCYMSKWLFYDNQVIRIALYNDWLIAVGGAMFFIMVISSQKILHFLNAKPLRLLGKISYSLLLYHLIVLFVCRRMLESNVSIPLFLIISIISSLVISFLAYRFIEVPLKKICKG